MDKAFLKFSKRHRSLLAATPMAFERYLGREIEWASSLIAVVGPRGVGKTTLLAQRLRRLALPPREALYVDLGDLLFHNIRLVDFAEYFIEQGGCYLFLDEVHRYPHDSWADEVKTLYDFYRSRLQIILSGSSILQILSASADLSRRIHFYHLAGLSFREYLVFTQEVELRHYDLDELLSEHRQIQESILSSMAFEPLPLFKTYLQRGYYAFVIEDDHGYYDQLNQIVQLVLTHDVALSAKGHRSDAAKLARLLQAVASSVPFKPNVSKLAERVALGRNTVVEYLQVLERAGIIQSLRAEGKGISVLSKPDKVFLDNTNLVYALSPQRADVGNIRETFLLNQLMTLRRRKLAFPPEITLPKKGDFHYRYQGAAYTFEVGGPGKTADQIGRTAGFYTVVDAKATATAHRIPLWLFGLLY